MKKYDGVFEKGLSKTRKTMEPAEDPGLDKALYIRFFQKQSQGQPIFSPLLCEKTLNFNKKLGGSDSFVASSGWLATFKNCHSIRQGSPNYGPRGHFVRPASRLPVAKNDQSSARCTRGIYPNPPKINQYLINTQLHMCTSDVNRAAYTAACGRARPRSAA